MNISGIFYKTTGLMSKKHIAKTAENIGTDLINIGLSKPQIEVNDIKQVIKSRIGEKQSSQILISDNFKDFRDFTMTNLKFTQEQSEKFFKGVYAAAIPGGGKINKSLLQLDLKKFESLNTLVNAVSHECEHLLYQRFGIFMGLVRKLAKNNNDDLPATFAGNMNAKLLEFQQELIKLSNLKAPVIGGFTRFKKGDSGILEQTNLKTLSDLHKKIEDILTSKILVVKNDQDKIPILAGLLTIIPDEIRAYKVGGIVERKLFHKNDRLTRSEMLAQVYSEALKTIKSVLKKEIISSRTNKNTNEIFKQDSIKLLSKQQ